MPTFKKRIVTSGTYLASAPGGGRTLQKITGDRIRHWAETANLMRGAGIRIPAPWAHQDKDGKLILPVHVATGDVLPRSDINGGWWEKFAIEKTEDGRDALVGYLDAPGDPEDANTPAGRLASGLVKETSVFSHPRFTDGQGRTWEDCIMHAAMVTHPIESGQDPFELAGLLSQRNSSGSEEGKTSFGLHGGMALCMSSRIDSIPSSTLEEVLMAETQTTPSTQPTSTSAAGGVVEEFTIEDAIAALAGMSIILPEGTTMDNFTERLIIALRQKAADKNESEESSITTEPSGSQTQPSPIAMSTPNQETQQVTLGQLAENVKTLAGAVSKLLEGQQALMSLANQATANHKKSLKERIDALVAGGRVSGNYAKTKLYPLLEGFSMSADGQESPLEQIVEGLESAAGGSNSDLLSLMSRAAYSQPGVPAGMSVEDFPPEESAAELSEDEINRIAEMA